MRLTLLFMLAVVVTVLHPRLRRLSPCELIGHDAHWLSPSIRHCSRCGRTWRRDVGDIVATTTNQRGGW